MYMYTDLILLIIVTWTLCIFRSLPGCCSPVIELLVTLSLDTQPAVADNANRTMVCIVYFLFVYLFVCLFLKEFLSASMKYPGTLTSIMEEKLYDLSSTLPRLMRNSSILYYTS